jgi:Putative zinc-binding metallo-peptidase
MLPRSDTFLESTGSSWSEERERLLRARVDQLGLRIEGSRLEPLVRQLYLELHEAGISLEPRVFLSDEWGCPEGIAAIGVPFYLADERLARLEKEEMESIEAESDAEIMAYLRHEAGHTFNYAYRLHETEDWHRLFGPYSRPYREHYEPNPFSRNFVRHISGWYAQKHPDEDFAETFAVWLTPGSDWRRVYADWGCLPKLQYVDETVRRIGRAAPVVTTEYDDAEELSWSVAEYHQRLSYQPVELPSHFDGDLRELFQQGEPASEGGVQAASEFMRTLRQPLVQDISHWTGLHEHIVRSLIEHFISRAGQLSLWLHEPEAERVRTKLTVYATTLCMNRLYKGDFIIK